LAVTKVLVLVLSFAAEPWRTIEREGQRPTWISQATEDTPVFFYQGRTDGLSYWSVGGALKASKFSSGLRRKLIASTASLFKEATLCGDTLMLDIPDTWGTINVKMRSAFRWALEHQNFDYVWRTNSSSYTKLDELKTWAQTLPDSGCYAGYWEEKRGLKLVTGSGFLLSRDLVEVAVNDPAWQHDFMDDVSLAWSMKRKGVHPLWRKRVDVRSPEAVASLTDEQVRSAIHFRCKNQADRMREVETMLDLHARIVQSRA
jgi:hypothetical protein